MQVAGMSYASSPTKTPPPPLTTTAAAMTSRMPPRATSSATTTLPSTRTGLAFSPSLRRRRRRRAGVAAVKYKAAVAAAVVEFDRDLGLGDSGAEVGKLQRWLARGSYLSANQIDGEFGESTRAAVASWQREHGLPSTGYFGRMSRSRLSDIQEAAVTTSAANVDNDALSSVHETTVGEMTKGVTTGMMSGGPAPLVTAVAAPIVAPPPPAATGGWASSMASGCPVLLGLVLVMATALVREGVVTRWWDSLKFSVFPDEDDDNDGEEYERDYYPQPPPLRYQPPPLTYSPQPMRSWQMPQSVSRQPMQSYHPQAMQQPYQAYQQPVQGPYPQAYVQPYQQPVQQPYQQQAVQQPLSASARLPSLPHAKKGKKPNNKRVEGENSNAATVQMASSFTPPTYTSPTTSASVVGELFPEEDREDRVRALTSAYTHRREAKSPPRVSTATPKPSSPTSPHPTSHPTSNPTPNPTSTPTSPSTAGKVQLPNIPYGSLDDVDDAVRSRQWQLTEAYRLRRERANNMNVGMHAHDNHDDDDDGDMVGHVGEESGKRSNNNNIVGLINGKAEENGVWTIVSDIL